MAQRSTSFQATDKDGNPLSFASQQDTTSGVLSPNHVMEVGGLPVSVENPVPVGHAAAPIIASAVLEGSHVFRIAAASVYAVTATGLSTFAWLLLFDAVAVPADGAVVPLQAIQATNLASVQIAFGGAAAAFGTGVVAALSTTGPFVKTTGPTGFLSALVT
jgi:hypothetical protein